MKKTFVTPQVELILTETLDVLTYSTLRFDANNAKGRATGIDCSGYYNNSEA